MRIEADQVRIFAAALLRGLGIGMTGVMLAIYLSALHWSIGRIGILIALGFAGAAAATLAVSFLADRFGRSRTLMVLGLFTAFGHFALGTMQRPWLLLTAAFFGMINGLGRARGAMYALEQALVPETTTPERRTIVLAIYGLILDGGVSIGSLLAGLPYLLRHHWGWDLLHSYQAAWLLAAALTLAALPIYSGLSSRVEVESAAHEALRLAPESKRRIAGLAAVTSVDSLGGGFVTSALVSYWFFRRFGVGEEWIGPMFLAAGVANAVSQVAAAWIARRIGLLNTIVFTHIPSSLFLIAVPFAPSFGWAATFFLAREMLVEMDVPTRQSYILAVVRREERSFASGVTAFTRNLGRMLGASLAGYTMSLVGLSSPLFFGGGAKIVHDLVLYVSFRHIRPPEETKNP